MNFRNGLRLKACPNYSQQVRNVKLKPKAFAVYCLPSSNPGMSLPNGPCQEQPFFGRLGPRLRLTRKF